LSIATAIEKPDVIVNREKKYKDCKVNDTMVAVLIGYNMFLLLLSSGLSFRLRKAFRKVIMAKKLAYAVSSPLDFNSPILYTNNN
jgi:hypothetical protein